ncbi:ABC transporter ATP-binding protein [Marinomonas sp.]|nr:ABC transporter ATP-binding protein [Marinomonas sp.]MDB4836859.1 ABC transporter ATP-binding protein [Marinomonas sp.]
MNDNVLEVTDLNVSAKTDKGKLFPIVKDLNFSIAPGKVLALIGESGSGKSTISLACMGFARAGCVITGGEARLDGTDVLSLNYGERRALRGADVSYVAQSAAASFNPALRIDRQVTETPIIKKLMTPQQANDKAISLYRELDLPNPEQIGNRYPHQVSGGQLQRIMAAMAMICDPKLLILDEPTTALDVTTQIEVLQSFKRMIKDRNTSAIYVSHDLSVVAQLADHILVLKDGEMVEYGSVDQILNNPKDEYTQKLISAAHVMPKTIVERPTDPELLKKRALLEVDNVVAGYGVNHQYLALKSVSLKVNKGQTVGVIGESGSGKTTLGRVISGLMDTKSGGVRLDNQYLVGDVGKRTKDDQRFIQFAFQMADVALNPRHRIRKILGRPLKFYFNMSEQEIDKRVAELLQLVELPESYADRFPRELSGGQRQRINLARALAAEPKVIILDEVTSALDTIVAESVLKLLNKIQDDIGVAYIFITHDISAIAKVSDTIYVMRHGELVDYGKTKDVLTPPCHEYTQLLLNSIPELRTDWLDDVMIKRAQSNQ